MRRAYLLIIFVILPACFGLFACAHQSHYRDTHLLGTPLPHSSDYYLNEATKMASPEREKHQLLAVQALLQEGKLGQAQQQLHRLDQAALPASLLAQKKIHSARLNLLSRHNTQALATLDAINPKQMPQKDQRAFLELMAVANERAGRPLASLIERERLDQFLEQKTDKTRNNQTIWRLLQQIPSHHIAALSHDPRFPKHSVLHGWFSLADLAQRYSEDEVALRQAVQVWQQQFPKHPGQAIITHSLMQGDPSSTIATKKNIVLLLPLHGQLAHAGQAVKNGFMAALYATPAARRAQFDVQVIDSSRAPSIRDLYQDAMRHTPDFIVGPLDRKKVDTLLIHGDISVPTLALNYSRSPYARQKNLFQFGLSPRDEAKQVADFAWKQGRSRAVMLIPEGQWGQDVAETFASHFLALGGTLVDTLTYNKKTDMNQAIKHFLQVDNSQARAKSLRKTLKQNFEYIPYHREDFDMFFLLATPKKARQIGPLLKFYYTGNIPVFATSAVYSGVADSKTDRDLEGIYFCDIPWILAPRKTNQLSPKAVAKLWPNNYNQYIRLYALGMDAYRLSQLPTRLSTFPNFRIQGATGDLTMDDKHHIHRQLVWVKMKNGKTELVH